MTVFYVVMLLLAVVGITEIISILIYHFTSCDECPSTLITTIKKDGDYEMAVRSAIERSKWGTFTPQKILIVTENLSQDTVSDILRMISAYPNIDVCDKKEIGKINSLL